MQDVILKVQIPVLASDPDAPALIYSRSRKLKVLVPVNQALRALVKDELKSFWWGHVDAEGNLVLKTKAEWQDW
jgi:hypothetical protein